MHVKLALFGIAATFLAQSQAVKLVIPQGMPDGHYSISTSPNGTASAPVLVSKFAKCSDNSDQFDLQNVLPNAQVGCNDRPLLTSDFEITKMGLNTWCDAGNQVRPGEHQYWQFGSATAYICNYGGFNPCSSAEYAATNQLEDIICGSTKGAWVKINDWAKSYGRDHSDFAEC
jgi:hypothetical protein